MEAALPKLIYILKEKANGTERYGTYELVLRNSYYDLRNFHVREYTNPVSSLDALAENLAVNRKYLKDIGLSFTKRDFFPDTFINDCTVRSYSELSPEEVAKFNDYLQKIMEGKPLKKRHNPEITAEDLAKVEVKE